LTPQKDASVDDIDKMKVAYFFIIIRIIIIIYIIFIRHTGRKQSNKKQYKNSKRDRQTDIYNRKT